MAQENRRASHGEGIPDDSDAGRVALSACTAFLLLDGVRDGDACAGVAYLAQYARGDESLAHIDAALVHVCRHGRQAS
ncbi:MAG: hypothetical protein AB7T63_14905 [Planctomycetota bacterium]